jgi:hypothetical protein
MLWRGLCVTKHLAQSIVFACLERGSYGSAELQLVFCTPPWLLCPHYPSARALRMSEEISKRRMIFKENKVMKTILAVWCGIWAGCLRW